MQIRNRGEKLIRVRILVRLHSHKKFKFYMKNMALNILNLSKRSKNTYEGRKPGLFINFGQSMLLDPDLGAHFQYEFGSGSMTA
jgi:hypothetical protein